MKFEESSLTAYLVKHLEPLTEADPSILAEYVVALLKKDKPSKELEKLCSDNLVEFLGHSTSSFVEKLFQTLENGSGIRANENLDDKKSEPSESPVLVDTVQPKSSSPKEEDLSTSSEQVNDSEDKEVTDDDDDRNHKHRRREARPDSFENDADEELTRRPNRKRNTPYDNRQLLLESNPRSNGIQKEYNPILDRGINRKFEKQRSGLTPLMRAPFEFGPRARVSHAFRTDLGPHFDLSTGVGRPPIGRGRGRSTVPWSQNDSRFNSLGTLDFASHMVSQGLTHPSMFMGTGLPSVANTQNASWGAFGFVPGMPNGILDPLHPLNLQGTLHPAINPPLNLSIPRPRCRDFEEQGFCLRGDMCPMEHGVNRIVVEDVQSLSQFNLPVSVPSSHTLGIQAGTGHLPLLTAPSSHMTNGKGILIKNSKSGVTDDHLKLNGVSSAQDGGDTDVYDPDQPLWNNDRPETSSALLRLSSPVIDNKSLWNTDSSAHQGFKLSDDNENEQPSGSFTANVGSQSTNPSFWGRTGPDVRTETGYKINDNLAFGNETKEEQEAATSNARVSDQGKCPVADETGPKSTAIKPVPRSRKDLGHNGGRVSQKARRTLFVSGIPHKSNRIENLLSHFQKFGEVIDIYIPLNGEKAFVQFSKREAAEAALKAPDAVMGNRFIKLWWANRDRIPEEGQDSGHINPVQYPGMVVTSVPPQPPAADREKASFLSAAQRGSSAPTAETEVPITVLPKNLLANGPKATPPGKKKQENLELLKEVLRKKQETLDQKRDDFRRQLDKLEKQAISNKKGETVPDHAVKRLKVDADSGDANPMTSKPTNLSITGSHQETEKLHEKSNSKENLASPNSKAKPTSLQQSPRNIKQACRLPAPSLNRYKLDNRPTSFRILPPLPEVLANVAALEDHFSSFGDLSSVVLEEPETCTVGAGSEPSQNYSACITFSTRNSAEKAYLTGRCCQGHNLQFTWQTVSPNSSSNGGGIQGNSHSSTPKVASKAEVQAEPVTSGSSSTSARRSICSVISEVADVRNGDPTDIEGRDYVPICVHEALTQISQSSSTMSSCEKCIHKSDFTRPGDNTDIGCAQ